MLAEFLAEKATQSVETARTYRTALWQFGLWLQRPLWDVRRADAAAWRAELEMQGCKPSTVQTKLNALKSFYGWARKRAKGQGPRAECEEWQRAADDLEDLPVPRSGRSVVRKALTQEQTDALLGGAPRALDRAVLLLFYATGARVSELAGLAWGDVTEHDGGASLVLHGKRGERECRIEAEAWEEFKGLRAKGRKAEGQEGESAPLLGGVNRHQIGRIVRRCGRAAGVVKAGLGPHTLRHSHATHAIRAGGVGAIPQVAAQLGHASTRTTMGAYFSALDAQGSGQYLKIKAWGKAERGQGEEQRGARLTLLGEAA